LDPYGTISLRRSVDDIQEVSYKQDMCNSESPKEFALDRSETRVGSGSLGHYWASNISTNP